MVVRHHARGRRPRAAVLAAAVGDGMMELLGLGGIGSVLTLAIWALLAERRAGKQDARAAELSVRMELAQATAKTQSLRADKEKERADGLDAVLDEIALRDDPGVARAHVLSRRARQSGAANGGDPGPMSSGGQPAKVASGSDDALLKPGE